MTSMYTSALSLIQPIKSVVEVATDDLTGNLDALVDAAKHVGMRSVVLAKHGTFADVTIKPTNVPFDDVVRAISSGWPGDLIIIDATSWSGRQALFVTEILPILASRGISVVFVTRGDLFTVRFVARRAHEVFGGKVTVVKPFVASQPFFDFVAS